jgi:hypothetical protein
MDRLPSEHKVLTNQVKRTKLKVRTVLVCFSVNMCVVCHELYYNGKKKRQPWESIKHHSTAERVQRDVTKDLIFSILRVHTLVA